MSFLCEPCWNNEHFRCQIPREFHLTSRGRCEKCGDIHNCVDCPTAHIEDQMRAANPELFQIIDDMKGANE